MNVLTVNSKIVGVIVGKSNSQSEASIKVMTEASGEFFELMRYNPQNLEIRGKNLSGLTTTEVLDLFDFENGIAQGIKLMN